MRKKHLSIITIMLLASSSFLIQPIFATSSATLRIIAYRKATGDVFYDSGERMFRQGELLLIAWHILAGAATGTIVIHLIKYVITGHPAFQGALEVANPISQIATKTLILLFCDQSIDVPITEPFGNATASWGFTVNGIGVESVGGVVVPVDKFGLLIPYIGLASTILVATTVTAVYVKRVRPRKKKQ